MSAFTDEQLRAAASTARGLFVEAAPGSGKTTVAAHRFALQRFGRADRRDPRGVVAVSFTRSATWELRTRVQRLWGSTALRPPHRIVTLDTLVCDLIHVLLGQGELQWPGGHTTLDVRDTWNALVETDFAFRGSAFTVTAGQVSVHRTTETTRATRPKPAQLIAKVQEGICTHDDVRAVLQMFLASSHVRSVLAAYLVGCIRSLIVDEIYDANELDLQIVQMACDAGIRVTLVGDPWQALYGFRGARPDLIPPLVSRNGMLQRPLSRSFRWRSGHQAALANQLRAGQPAALPTATSDEMPDVVLASEWSHLWDLEASMLPLAFGSPKGKAEEAGATLLLDFLTRSLLELDAVYAADALSTLRIDDEEAISRLDVGWPSVIGALRAPGRDGPRAAYGAMVELMATESDATFRAVHGSYTKRLERLRSRLDLGVNLIAGMTVHQAKGREWDVVSVVLRDTHAARLEAGLSWERPGDRQLYVACTRARHRTVGM